MKFYTFRAVPLSIIRTACEQNQAVSSWSCSQAVSKPV